MLDKNGLAGTHEWEAASKNLNVGPLLIKNFAGEMTMAPSSENPQHREDFTRLVSAAAKKQKPAG